jgi:hypothetical protein
MVSRPTLKPIPIPLSVRVQDDETFDSVDDLLASIRELVSPGALDIIDLNRPVHPGPDPVSPLGQGQQSGIGPHPQPRNTHTYTAVQSPRNTASAHPDTTTEPLHPGPDPVKPLGHSKNDVYCGVQEMHPLASVSLQMKRHLSEKTRSESTKVLSSFISALEGPKQDLEFHTDPSVQGVQQDGSGHRGDRRAKGICLEDLVAQCLKAPLNQWIEQNDAVISQHVKTIIEQHMSEFLHQWLDAHLPQLIKAYVDQHLDALTQSVRKK